MMRDSIPPLLWAWAILSPLLFRLLPGRDAAITCLVAGWACLPVMAYPPDVLVDSTGAAFAHAVALPTPLLVNKATAIGLGCLAGLIFFDRRAFGQLRFDLVDLPMLAWCLIPVASSASNGLPLSEGLSQSRYLALAWGVPYLMGRAYLVDPDSRSRFAIGLAAGGLAYLPICVLEFFRGPTVYRFVYGPHPYEFEGAIRPIGHRPLGFMEHGNQLGMWMAGAAVAATWIWSTGISKKPCGVPAGILAAILVGLTLLCQSHSSILLMIVALMPLLIGRFNRGRFAWRTAAGALLAITILVVFLAALRRGFDLGALRLEGRNFFRGISKSSFTWRLARSEQYFPIVMQRPWLGWARADWNSHGRTFVNPVNLPLWLLALGMYGFLGLAALMATWIVPVSRSIRRKQRSWLGPGGGATGTLVALIVINFLDSFSNAVVIVPILAAVGDLNRPSTGPKGEV